MASDRFGNTVISDDLNRINYQQYMGMMQGLPKPPEERSNEAEDSPDTTGGTTTAQDVRDARDSISPSGFLEKAALKFGTPLAISAVPAIAPVAIPAIAMYGAFKTGLGGIAATMESLESGILGDALGARSQEGLRDAAETAGFSRDQTARGAANDQSIGGYTGFNPGVGTSGYGLDPGLSNMSGLGTASRDAFGGTSGLDGFGRSAEDVSVDTDLDGIGNISDVGSTTRGGYSASLGDSAAGDGGSEGSDSSSSGSGVGGFGGGDLGKGGESW